MDHAIKRQSLTALAAAFMLAVSGLQAVAVDNAHFYKPPSMYGTSPTGWFDHDRGCNTQDWLTKVDVSFAAGETREGWNRAGNSSNVLNPVGPTNLLYLGKDVPALPNIQNFATFINRRPSLLAGQEAGTFGFVEFSGKFSTWEFDLSWRQNLLKGLFLEFGMPIRQAKIDSINYTDLSPVAGNGGSNQGNPEWKQLLNNLDSLLANYGIAPLKSTWSKTGVGDLSILAGWEKMYTVAYDHFFGITLKGGILVPTGAERDQNRVFAVPLGYNKHVGINGLCQVQIGVMPWMTLRGNIGITYLLKDSEKDVRVKTFSKQNGYLLLAKGRMSEDPGFLWHAGADLSFDHIAAGLSARVGYSFTRQEETKYTPANTTVYNKDLINNNHMYKAWHLHVVHFAADVDTSVYTEKPTTWAPRITGFYNMPVEGNNAFKTSMVGGSLGLDLRWHI